MFGFLSGKPPEDPAERLIREGRAEEAVRHCLDLLRRGTQGPWPLIHLGCATFVLGAHADSKDWFLKACRQPLSEPQIAAILEATNHLKIASEAYFNSYPAFSPDGRLLAYTSARRDQNGDGRIDGEESAGIRLYDLATGRETLAVEDAFRNSHPCFSPDGESLAFLSERPDPDRRGGAEGAGLYLKNLKTGEERLLIAPEHRPKFPSFSPDGRSLLFSGWYFNPRSGIYLMDLESGIVRGLQSQFESTFPAFSPRGERVLYASWRRDSNGDGIIDLKDNSALYEIDLEKREERCLVPDRFNNAYAVYAPDGGSIAYLSRRRDTNGDGLENSLDNSGVYVLSLRSGRERLISGDDRYNKFPFFSSDGLSVGFVSAAESDPGADRPAYYDFKGLFCAPREGGRAQTVVSNRHYGCRFPAASPRENLVAYVSWRREGGRGLYLARLDRPPSLEELKAVIAAAF